MVDVLTEILIACPRDKVWEYAANPDNAPEWYVNIKAAECKTPNPLVPGSRIAFIAHFLGRQLAYVYEIAELVPLQKLVMRTADGPFPMETTYTWDAIDVHTTRMTVRNRGNPAGFSRLMAPFMSFMMKKANKSDLKQIKAILEARC